MNEFRKQLKKFGMQREFQNWLKNESTMPKVLQVGSKVRVGAFNSDYYKSGNVGVVKEIRDFVLLVRFDELSHNPGDWVIGAKKVEVI